MLCVLSSKYFIVFQNSDLRGQGHNDTVVLILMRLFTFVYLDKSYTEKLQNLCCVQNLFNISTFIVRKIQFCKKKHTYGVSCHKQNLLLSE